VKRLACASNHYLSLLQLSSLLHFFIHSIAHFGRHTELALASHFKIEVASTHDHPLKPNNFANAFQSIEHPQPTSISIVNQVKMLVKMENKRLLVGYRKGDWQEVYYEPFARSAEKDKYKCPLVLLFHSARADHEANKNPLAEEVNWLPQYDPTNFEVLAKGQKDIHPWFLFRCWQYMGGATKKELNDNQFDRPNYVRWQIWKKAADKKLKRTKPSTLGEKRTAEGEWLELSTFSGANFRF
jgi:hypothetical protein